MAVLLFNPEYKHKRLLVGDTMLETKRGNFWQVLNLRLDVVADI